jgi:hypothetical protein
VDAHGYVSVQLFWFWVMKFETNEKPKIFFSWNLVSYNVLEYKVLLLFILLENFQLSRRRKAM